jgi:histidine ammonia-lyase
LKVAIVSEFARFLAAACVSFCIGDTAQAQALVLDGRSLSPPDVVAVARDRLPVAVDEAAWERVRLSHLVLMGAAQACQKIYGLTTGVGANKDRGAVACTHAPLSEETLDASRDFNVGLLYAHSAATGAPLPPEVVRAILLIRLNTALDGGTGMQESVVRRFADYLANDILPVIPSHGSVGQADITVLSHIGLTMIDKWEVFANGERMPAADANAAAGLSKVDFVAKDALGSFSSNAFGTALASFALADFQQASQMARLILALSLEGLNGNVAPYLPETGAKRPFPYVAAAAGDLLTITTGSYLYEYSDTRALQDPLSYRTAAYQLGALDRSLAQLEDLLRIQINGADDNPVVYVGAVGEVTAAMPEIKPVAQPGLQGAVVPSANFSPLPIAVALQSSGIAGAHVSHGAVMRTLKLVNPDFTHLPNRFLTADADGNGHAFGAIHKPIVALMAQNRELANPVSLDFVPLALDIEDMATNMPRAAQRLQQMAANLHTILGFELMLAAQAVDLRLQQNPNVALSPMTRQLHAEFRTRVPFLAADNRILTRDIANAAAFVAACRLEAHASGDIDWASQLYDGVLCGG